MQRGKIIQFTYITLSLILLKLQYLYIMSCHLNYGLDS